MLLNKYYALDNMQSCLAYNDSRLIWLHFAHHFPYLERQKIDEQNPLNTTAHTCGFWDFFFIIAYLILQKKEGFHFKPTDTFLIDSYKLPKYFGGL